mgnify:CR=1 FL=1
MKFKKEFLQKCEGETISDVIIENSRWSIYYERIFKYDGKFYLTNYSVGATEQQDESPYEYEPDEIDCVEVEPVEKVVIVYQPVKET